MATETVTADERLAMQDDGFLYDLIRGELKRMSPAGSKHGAIGMRFAAIPGAHVKSNGLGLVFGPDTVRTPDVSFVRRERNPDAGLPEG